MLGGDKVNVMTLIFFQHSADREGHRERLAEKQHGVFIPPYFKAEAVRKSSRQLQVLLGKNHLLFVVETYHTFTFSSFVFSLYNSQAQPMSTAQRPPKSTTEKVPGPDVTRVRPSCSRGRTAEVTPIQSCRRPLFNH